MSFLNLFVLGAAISNDEMMEERGEEYKRDMARQLSGSQCNTLELYFFKPSCQFNWLQTVFGQRPWQFVRRRRRWMELHWVSCVPFSFAGWPFNRNESASFAHFLRSVSSTLSGVRRGETNNFALICVFCVFVFLSRATLVIPPGQHLSLLPPLTLVGRRHTGTTLLQAQSWLKISQNSRPLLE